MLGLPGDSWDGIPRQSEGLPMSRCSMSLTVSRSCTGISPPGTFSSQPTVSSRFVTLVLQRFAGLSRLSVVSRTCTNQTTTRRNPTVPSQSSGWHSSLSRTGGLYPSLGVTTTTPDCSRRSLTSGRSVSSSGSCSAWAGLPTLELTPGTDSVRCCWMTTGCRSHSSLPGKSSGS